MPLYEKDDKVIINHVTSRFTELSNMRKDLEDMWNRYYKLYRSIMDDAWKKEVGANIFVPYVFQIVETVKPRIVTTMLAARPYIGLISIEDDKQENAEIMTNFIDYQLNQKMCFTKIASNTVISALIYGTGITKQSWEYEEKPKKRRVPNIDPETGTVLGYKVITENKKVKDNPVVKHIDIFDFYVDPFIETIDEQPDCIHRYFKSARDLKKMLKAMDADESIVDKIKDGDNGNQDPTGVIKRLTDNGISAENKGRNDIEILEYFTDEEWIIIANREFVVVAEENPYWHGRKPFAKLVDIDVPGEFYGIGEIEPVEYLQHELNTMRNQRVDNVNIIINKMYSVLRGANIDPEQLITRPGGFVEVDTHDDIKPIEFDDVTQNAYQEDQMVKDDLDKTSGVFDYTRGASGARRETATTATILSDASNERFKLKVQMFESTWLVELGRQICELNQQYIDEEQVVANINGDVTKDVRVSPESIDGDFEFMAIGSSVDPIYNKAARQQVMLTLFQTLAPLPYINGKTLAKYLLKAYDVREIDQIILAEEQMPPIDSNGNQIDANGNVVAMAQPPNMAGQAMGGGQEMMAGQDGQSAISPEEARAVVEQLPPDVMDAIVSQLEQGQVPDGVPQEILDEIVRQLQSGEEGQMNVQ